VDAVALRPAASFGVEAGWTIAAAAAVGQCDSTVLAKRLHLPLHNAANNGA